MAPSKGYCVVCLRCSQEKVANIVIPSKGLNTSDVYVELKVIKEGRNTNDPVLFEYERIQIIKKTYLTAFMVFI